MGIRILYVIKPSPDEEPDWVPPATTDPEELRDEEMAWQAFMIQGGIEVPEAERIRPNKYLGEV
ncbi:MAG: hypothetical protein IRZ06_12345 [Nevskia sp.]|nr:hypothetical protein [Nevskia sp.]